MPQSALFLDRDGVINVDRGYVYRIEEFEFTPAIFELARFAAQELRWLIVVTTNQAGIGRGYYTEEDYQTLTRWMCGRFERENAPIARVYHCPYHPVHGIGHYRLDHPWRKPRPGMILQAAADLNLDLANSALVGDKMSDIDAGVTAGIGLCILVDRRGHPTDSETPTHEVVADLTEAIRLLREHRRRHASRVD